MTGPVVCPDCGGPMEDVERLFGCPKCLVMVSKATGAIIRIASPDKVPPHAMEEARKMANALGKDPEGLILHFDEVVES